MAKSVVSVTPSRGRAVARTPAKSHGRSSAKSRVGSAKSNKSRRSDKKKPKKVKKDKKKDKKEKTERGKSRRGKSRRDASEEEAPEEPKPLTQDNIQRAHKGDSNLHRTCTVAHECDICHRRVKVGDQQYRKTEFHMACGFQRTNANYTIAKHSHVHIEMFHYGCFIV